MEIYQSEEGTFLSFFCRNASTSYILSLVNWDHLILFLQSLWLQITCVNNGIEIPLSLQCKILLYTILSLTTFNWSAIFIFPVQDSSSSLATTWSQKFRTTRNEPFQTHVIKLQKRAFMCYVLLWKIFVWVSIDIYKYHNCLNIYIFTNTNFLNLCSTWN